jgi:putative copper export protein
MAPQQIVFALITFLHDLFTAAWIGSLLTLSLSVLPAARKTLGAQDAQRLLGAIQRRLSVIATVSIAGLAVTGLLMSRRAPGFTGLFTFGTPYAAALSLKHLAMAGMIAVTLARSVLLPRLRQPQPDRARWSMGLLLANMSLGVFVLLITGFVVALGATPPGA